MAVHGSQCSRRSYKVQGTAKYESRVILHFRYSEDINRFVDHGEEDNWKKRVCLEDRNGRSFFRYTFIEYFKTHEESVTWRKDLKNKMPNKGKSIWSDR